MNHLKVIDCLRGIAALSVCIFHFVLGHGDYLNAYPTLKSVSSFGWLGVEMFFVISGFVIPYSMAKYDYNFGKFWFFLKKRIFRIEPPYLISVLVAFLLLWASSIFLNKQDSDFSFTQLVLHVGYLNPFFGYRWIEEFYWTLGVEFQFYLFMGLFYTLMFRNKKSFFLFLLLICIFPLLKDNYKTFLSYSTFFCFGFIAKAYFLKNINKIEAGLCTLVVFAACLYFFKVEQAIAGLSTLAIILFLTDVANKPLLFLGKISFSLYLTHDIFGGRVINYLNKSSHQINPIFILCIGILFSIGVAYVFYRLIELPSIKLAKNVKVTS